MKQNNPSDPGRNQPNTWNLRVPDRQLPGLISAVTLLAGIWLLLAPDLWNLQVRWNNLSAGIALIALGIARLTQAVRLLTVTILSVTLGVWLAIAPFVLAYSRDADATAATANTTIVGVLISGLAFAGYLHARDDAHPPET